MVRLSVAEKAVIGERSAAGVSSRQMSRELGRPANGVGLCGVAATTSASSTAALCSALVVAEREEISRGLAESRPVRVIAAGVGR